jgi:hypothetical protein
MQSFLNCLGFDSYPMKVYNLNCGHGHRFEGWFSSEDDFIAQCDARKIECPLCDDRSINRLPSAPHLSLSGSTQPNPKPQSEPEKEAVELLRAQWMEMARDVIAATDDVGAGFAEEARRIHYQEAPPRAIRGVTTRHERDALRDEGIDVVQFPIPDALKRPLH